jgi:RNA polymerase sigma factor (sigma-70 family)
MSTAFSELPEKYLTPRQEQLLAKRIQKYQRQSDINSLVMSNMREAVIYSRRCSRQSLEDSVLISVCYGALVRSAKRFKAGYGMRFFGFAKAALRGDISAYYKTLEVVKNAGEHAQPPLEEFKSTAMAEEEPTTEADFQSIFARDDWKMIAEVIKRKCNAQEKMVLDLSYQKHLNFQEIGQLLGVSRSAIQAAHARAIRKIRNELNRLGRLSK